MKIAWVTPFFLASAIGKYSKSATDELCKHSFVDLWVPSGKASRSNPLLKSNLKIILFKLGDKNLNKLSDYDLVVYNLGNYPLFHRDIYEVSKKIKGVVILHDFVMHNFFADYYLNSHLDGRNVYVAWMRRLYGQDGEKTALDSLSGKTRPVWETAEVTKYPFFEKAIEGSLGVIVHSHFLEEKVRKIFPGPISTLYHPFPPSTIKMEEKQSGNKLLLLSIGHVTPSKRIHKVIKAIGESGENVEKVEYVLLGNHDEDQKYFILLQEIITKYNLQSRVKFLGRQPDNILHDYLSRCDVCVNLRYPTTEGASYALVEELHYGKPVLVTDVGFYGEIPSDAVVKINPNHEEEELAAALGKLISNRAFREETGKKGKEFALKHFSPSEYCEGFLKFCEDAKRYRPLLDLSETINSELTAIRCEKAGKCADIVTTEINLMFER